MKALFVSMIFLAVSLPFAQASTQQLKQIQTAICATGMDSSLEVEVQPKYFCATEVQYPRGPYYETACVSVDSKENVYILTSAGADVGDESSRIGFSYDFFSKDDFTATLSGMNTVYETPSQLELVIERWGKDESQLIINKSSNKALFYGTGEEITLECTELF